MSYPYPYPYQYQQPSPPPSQPSPPPPVSRGGSVNWKRVALVLVLVITPVIIIAVLLGTGELGGGINFDQDKPDPNDDFDKDGIPDDKDPFPYDPSNGAAPDVNTPGPVTSMDTLTSNEVINRIESAFAMQEDPSWLSSLPSISGTHAPYQYHYMESNVASAGFSKLNSIFTEYGLTSIQYSTTNNILCIFENADRIRKGSVMVGAIAVLSVRATDTSTGLYVYILYVLPASDVDWGTLTAPGQYFIDAQTEQLALVGNSINVYNVGYEQVPDTGTTSDPPTDTGTTGSATGGLTLDESNALVASILSLYGFQPDLLSGFSTNAGMKNPPPYHAVWSSTINDIITLSISDPFYRHEAGKNTLTIIMKADMLPYTAPVVGVAFLSFGSTSIYVFALNDIPMGDILNGGSIVNTVVTYFSVTHINVIDDDVKTYEVMGSVVTQTFL